MTREEAIEILKNPDEIYQGSDGVTGYTYNPRRKNYEAFQLAIKALEQEPCKDAVSRKSVLNQIFYSTDNSGDAVLGSNLRKRIEELPPVTPTRIETVTEFADRCRECGKMKKGKWIKQYTAFVNDDNQIVTECHCNNCYGISYFRSMNGELVGAKYCPNCGAEMEVEK